MSIQHLAIIPDGNRRWAAERGLPAVEGHRRGYDKVKDIGSWCVDRGIFFLTVWGFSTDNWGRGEQEVGYLMDLIHVALTREIGFYNKNGIRLRVMGLREGLPLRVVRAIEDAEARTAANARGQLNLCINYGGRAEMVAAARSLVASGCRPEDITEETFGASTWFAGIPDPDLVVRTSGEQRLSGFLPWSGAYSELLFVREYFPDFSEATLDAAIAEYESRTRRFGK